MLDFADTLQTKASVSYDVSVRAAVHFQLRNTVTQWQKAREKVKIKVTSKPLTMKANWANFWRI